MSISRQYSYSTWQLLRRTLTPSYTSLALCMCLGVLITIVHFMMLSLNEGALLPQLFDGEWATFYSNHISQPLLSTFNNQTLSLVLMAAMWGLIGLVIYTIIVVVGGSISGFRDSERTITVGLNGAERHPLAKNFAGQLLWRAAMGMVMVGLIILMQHPISRVLAGNQKVYVGTFMVGGIVRQVIVSALFWAVLLQVYVILLRLYVLRTRLFGEILY